MLVTRSNFSDVMTQVSSWPEIAADTETNGLRPYLGHRPFSLQMSNGTDAFYFPIADASGISGEQVLGEPELRGLQLFFSITPRTYFLQNAKFDLHHLHVAGFHLHEKSPIHDTAVLARLVNSDLKSYSMAALAERFLADRKFDTVMAYVKEQKWIEDDPADIREGRKDNLVHFERVPLEIMLPYAEQDVIVTFRLAKELQRILAERDKTLLVNERPSGALIANEAKLVHTVYGMERDGIRVDIDYVKKGLAYAKEQIEKGQEKFKALTGEEYVASSKRFVEMFIAAGVSPDSFDESDKGNLRCDRAALERIGGEVALCILDVKNNKTRSNYFTGFLRFADSGNRIHTDFKQYGTITGRFSSSDPNLQNLKKAEEIDFENPEEVDPFPIRRAFIPDHDCVLFMPDYQAMEYRMMLDYAQAHTLIAQVIAGLDLHQVTADMAGITRKHAKTLNFAILFGAGPSKIAGMLGLDTEAAKMLIRKYYRALPEVEQFIDKVRAKAKQKGYLTNWYGRRFLYTNPNDAFKGVNHLIQGGCADIMRIAMNQCADLLDASSSTMNLTIHDELVFNLHRDELDFAPQIIDIMEKAYPHKVMPHKVEPSYSWLNLNDKSKGFPTLPS